MRGLNRCGGLNDSLRHGSRRQRPQLRHENADCRFREKFRAQRPATVLPLPQSAAVMRKPGTSDENAAKLSPEIILTQIIADKSQKMAALIKDETF